MNRIFICFLIMTGLVFAACSKKKTAAPANNLQSNPDSNVFMSATVNGTSWHTDSAIGYNILTSTNDSNRLGYQLTGTYNGGAITLYITNYSGPAVYTINPPAISATYNMGNQRHYASSGQIEIISDTAYALIGNFNFTADSITVTNGKFNAAY